MALLIIPLLAVDLTSPFEDILTSTDASNKGLGVSEARVERDQIHLLARHSCFRGDYCETPGLFCWDKEASQRMKALRVDTQGLVWAHVVSVPRRVSHHISVMAWLQRLLVRVEAASEGTETKSASQDRIS